jgi:hypothetical protein
MDSSLTVEKVELATITRDEADGKVGRVEGVLMGMWGVTRA